ncbi:MAG: hypothetical protein U1C72_01120, partial [Candidatus Pacearchaeota archaeon]|nr:hypothetical protein [Candidatus Pacearchaeota archaeon]
MNRFLLTLFVVAFCASILGGSFLFWQGKFQGEFLSANLSLTENTTETEDGITLLFAGDVMLDRGVEWYIKQ